MSKNESFDSLDPQYLNRFNLHNTLSSSENESTPSKSTSFSSSSKRSFEHLEASDMEPSPNPPSKLYVRQLCKPTTPSFQLDKILYPNTPSSNIYTDAGPSRYPGSNYIQGVTREPSSPLDPKDLAHPRWQIPRRIITAYKEKGFLTMYDWQYEALSQEGVYEGKRNLLFSSPTASGKTFVAELLVLKKYVVHGKKSIIVLPYVSLAAEKTRDLKSLFKSLRIVGYFGSNGPKHFEWDIAICTIEKAVGLIHRFLDELKLNELGCFCIDELHMVSDPQRGYLIELMITQLQFLNVPIQFIGFSATIPNIDILAQWLKAALYVTDFRPTPIHEFIKVQSQVYDKDMNVIRVFKETREEDVDHLIPLCWDIVWENKSVLVFCATKLQAQNTALLISKFITNTANEETFIHRQSLITALSKCPCGLDPILNQTISYGVAFHHAGLTLEERELIEDAFRESIILILVATCTLSIGVNLPARRIIFRSPYIGRTFMSPTEYKQMSRRAGRKGQDTVGESVLICSIKEFEKVKKSVNAALPPISSCLIQEQHCMIRAILEAIGTGLVQSMTDLKKYLKCSLLSIEKTYESILKEIQNALDYLKEMELIEENEIEREKMLVPTKLGKAIISSSIKPNEALVIFKELKKASTCFVVASELHSIYLSIPPQVTVEPDWSQFLKLYERLDPVNQSVANALGINESFLLRATVQRMNSHPHVQVYKQFYAALILYDLIKETPMDQVVSIYHVDKGQIQILQQLCSTFASLLVSFCKKLGWKGMSLLFDQLKDRFQYCVEEDLLPLTKIPYVKTFRARCLFNAGYRSIYDLAKANPVDIANLLIEKTPFVSKKDAPKSASLHIAIEHRAAQRIIQGAIELVREEAEAMERELDANKKLLNKEEATGFVRSESNSSLGSDSLRLTMDSPQYN